MARSAKEIMDRLGSVGLGRVLEDLLDQNRLVRLANACELKYPGMRTQSQSRSRLLRDLADKARKQVDVRKAVMRALDKEVDQAKREWDALDAEEKVRRLCDESFLRAGGNLGRYLFLLASGPDVTELDGLGARVAHEHLIRIASNGTNTPQPGKRSREEARLKRQVQERDRKMSHLEAQLAKTRETQKTVKRDLIQRKGELAESRMLVERLRRDLSQAEAAVQIASAEKPASPATDKVAGQLSKSLRQLAAEQKKLVHRLQALLDKRAARGAGQSPVLEALAGLDKRTAADARQREKDLEAVSKRVDALRSEIRARQPTAVAKKPSRRSRPKSAALRIGVFIDVQNVYYSARRLKGKLYFDALIQAAVQERRLIKATAYVVESKETDQSQFIARLEQRGIEVRRKTLRVRADGSMKGDWDMELALDILDAAPRLDVVVLVSGDGDFTSLVKRVKSMGPRVEVIAFPRNTAKSLVQAADHFEPLDRKFMIYSKPPKTPATKRPAAATREAPERKRSGPAPKPAPAGTTTAEPAPVTKGQTTQSQSA